MAWPTKAPTAPRGPCPCRAGVYPFPVRYGVLPCLWWYYVMVYDDLMYHVPLVLAELKVSHLLKHLANWTWANHTRASTAGCEAPALRADKNIG